MVSWRYFLFGTSPRCGCAHALMSVQVPECFCSVLAGQHYPLLDFDGPRPVDIVAAHRYQGLISMRVPVENLVQNR